MLENIFLLLLLLLVYFHGQCSKAFKRRLEEEKTNKVLWTMSHFIFDSQIFDHFDQKSPVQFWQQGYFSTDHFLKGNKWKNNVIFFGNWRRKTSRWKNSCQFVDVGVGKPFQSCHLPFGTSIHVGFQSVTRLE